MKQTIMHVEKYADSWQAEIMLNKWITTATTSMCQTNFRLRYTPGQHISLDESTMAYIGRVTKVQWLSKAE